jgi:hypothetical protein
MGQAPIAASEPFKVKYSKYETAYITSLVIDIAAGDGKFENLFYSVVNKTILYARQL